MLIEFRVENHRSIKDEQALSMEASDLADSADRRSRQVPGYAKRLLPAVAVMGLILAAPASEVNHVAG